MSKSGPKYSTTEGGGRDGVCGASTSADSWDCRVYPDLVSVAPSVESNVVRNPCGPWDKRYPLSDVDEPISEDPKNLQDVAIQTPLIFKTPELPYSDRSVPSRCIRG